MTDDPPDSRIVAYLTQNPDGSYRGFPTQEARDEYLVSLLDK